MSHTQDAIDALDALDAAAIHLRRRLDDPLWERDDPMGRAAAAFEVSRDIRRRCEALAAALLADSLERGVGPRVMDLMDPLDRPEE